MMEISDSAALLREDFVSSGNMMLLTDPNESPAAQKTVLETTSPRSDNKVDSPSKGGDSSSALCSVNKVSTNAPAVFPLKLYELLEEAETKEFEHIISWLPCGTGLKVHSQKDFEEEGIMSRYFKQTRYKSFQKQLNLYRFQRETKGPNKGSYSHPLFRRGRLDLCKLIARDGGIKNARLQNGVWDAFFLVKSRRDNMFRNDAGTGTGQGDDDLLEVLANEKFTRARTDAGSNSPVACMETEFTNTVAGCAKPTSANKSASEIMMNQVSEDIIDEIIFTFGDMA